MCIAVAVGERASYLMFTQGMYILETPFNPTNDNKGKHVLYIPGTLIYTGKHVLNNTRYSNLY